MITPIAISAPVERLGASGGASGTVRELVLDAIVTPLRLDVVLALLGLDIGKSESLEVESDNGELKASKISVSVLCHRTWTLYAFTPQPDGT